MENIEISLSKDEALVLFEFLARFSTSDKLEIVDQAEERALWNIEALLEKILVEPFSENWTSIIAEARRRLRDAV